MTLDHAALLRVLEAMKAAAGPVCAASRREPITWTKPSFLSMRYRCA
jgi:hypothetical protein